MNYQNLASNAMPTAHIAANKSRLKVYNLKSNNAGNLPTYYLQKGQEFQIELFNPTQDVILAKISLNSKLISQGGLVLKPGERVFLDRYLDVAKKFMFDTYEVSGNSQEVQKAIEHNGDVKIEFFREYKPITYGNPIWINCSAGTGTLTRGFCGTSTTTTYDSGSVTSAGLNAQNCSYTSGADLGATLDSLSMDFCDSETQAPSKKRSKKSIETGRVEEGSKSSQEFTYVNKSFEYFAFHTVEYKLMPVSQKVSSTADLNVRRYCTNCGKKQGAGDNFCSSCGKRQ